MGLCAEGAEAVGPDQLSKLRVAFRPAEIPGQKFLFVWQNCLVDKPDQPIEIHDVLFNRCAGEQQLKRSASDALEGFRLLVALLVNSGEGVGLLEYHQIPGDSLGGFFVGSGKFIGRDDNGALAKRVWLVRRYKGIPLGTGGEDNIGDRIELLHQRRPLAEQVGVGHGQQDVPRSLQPPLGDDQHGLMALAQTRLVAQHRALLVPGTERKICRRDLEGVYFDVGGGVNRQQSLLRWERFYVPGPIKIMKCGLFHWMLPRPPKCSRCFSSDAFFQIYDNVAGPFCQ